MRKIKMSIIFILVILCIICNVVQAKTDSLHYKRNQLGSTLYYNKHNQYFSNGTMFDVNYEYIFNRWVGIQTSFGFNRANVNLTKWKEDYINSNGFLGEFPSLTSSILFNIIGNFYCINKQKHRLKLGFGLEYRNINDVISNSLLNLDLTLPFNPELIFTQTEFEKFNDLGISGNISYQYIFKKGLGINTTMGYNHYFTNMSQKAKRGERFGGSSFLKIGLGINYSF
jgi:hypothetical protein